MNTLYNTYICMLITIDFPVHLSLSFLSQTTSLHVYNETSFVSSLHTLVPCIVASILTVI